MLKVYSFISISFFSLSVMSQGFTNRALELGIDNLADGTIYGGGVSTFDWNYDGLDDIVLLRMDSLPFFYENNGNGFTRVYFEGIDIQNESKSVNWVDINNDGNLDLSFNSYNAGPSLYVNLGDFVFQNITASSGIQGIETDQGFGHNWGDYDNYGFLDLFVANFNWDSGPIGYNKLFHNNGDLTFTDVSAEVGLEQDHEPTFLGVWADYNNDNKTDLFVLNDREDYNNDLYENDGNGHFTEMGIPSNIYRPMCSMTGTVGDYDNDGYFDLYVTNTPLNGNRLYRNSASGVFSSVAHLIGVASYQYCWGATWIDYDNNGWQDLFVTSQIGVDWPGAHFFFRNFEGTFESDISAGFLGSEGNTYTVARGDFNNDGFPDMVVNSDTTLRTEVFINNAVGGNYLRVRLQGQISNRDAIGCRIESHSASGKQFRYTFCGEQFLSQNSQWQHFGLGSDNQIDSLVILWPSGIRDVFYDVEANQNLFILEGSSSQAFISITSGSNILCQGESVVLSAGDFESYLWSTGETTQSITISEPDFVYFQATSNGITVYSDTISITLTELPQYDLIVTPPSCFEANDGALEVISNSEALFTWQGQSQGNLIENIPAGDFQLTVDYGNSCQSQSVISLEQPSKVEADSIQLEFIQTSSNGCDNSFTASCIPQGGTPPYFKQWFLLNPTGTNVLDSFEGDSYICLPADESSIVKCVFSDSNGCTDSIQTQINISSLENTSEDFFLNIWPNPAENVLNIRYSNTLNEIQIFDMLGKAYYVEMTKQNDFISLNIEALPRGSFVLSVIDKSGESFRCQFQKIR